MAAIAAAAVPPAPKIATVLPATCAILASGVLVLLSHFGYPTAGLVVAAVVGAGLCLLARWRGWILPSADAWSPTRMVPASYRERLRRRTKRPGPGDE